METKKRWAMDMIYQSMMMRRKWTGRGKIGIVQIDTDTVSSSS
jgi:hypothetical protein